MSWITVDTALPNHRKMADLPSDAARWGWLVSLCEAKEQRTPGTFASEKHYRHVMPRHGRFLPDYLRVGLMDKGDDGTLHVHDWRKHQWAAAKGHQRDKAKTSDGPKDDPRALSLSLSMSKDEVEDETVVLAWLAKVGATVQPDGNGYHRELVRFIARQGASAVLEAMKARYAAGDRSARQLIYGAQNDLEQIHRPSGKSTKGMTGNAKEAERAFRTA